MEKPPHIDRLFEGDPYLKDYEHDISLRWKKMAKLESMLSSEEGGLGEFAKSYKEYGIVQKETGEVKV